jgi:hypothetical protein
LEATGNSDAIATLLAPIVGRVVVSNPSKTRAIAEAKVKIDKVDARILAQLLAADFLPPVWLPDDRTRALRRQVHPPRYPGPATNQDQEPGPRDLGPQPRPDPPVSDLFGKTGRHCLSAQPLPADERSSGQALQQAADFHGAELAVQGAGCGGPDPSGRGPADDHLRSGRHRWHGDRGRGGRIPSLPRR